MCYLFATALGTCFYCAIEMLWGIGQGRQFYILNIDQFNSFHWLEKMLKVTLMDQQLL